MRMQKCDDVDRRVLPLVLRRPLVKVLGAARGRGGAATGLIPVSAIIEIPGVITRIPHIAVAV
jgi:hypothetical protein